LPSMLSPRRAARGGSTCSTRAPAVGLPGPEHLTRPGRDEAALGGAGPAGGRVPGDVAPPFGVVRGQGDARGPHDRDRGRVDGYVEVRQAGTRVAGSNAASSSKPWPSSAEAITSISSAPGCSSRVCTESAGTAVSAGTDPRSGRAASVTKPGEAQMVSASASTSGVNRSSSLVMVLRARASGPSPAGSQDAGVRRRPGASLARPAIATPLSVVTP
jgi:hypothetical protein